MPADKVKYFAEHDPLIVGKAYLDQHPDIKTGDISEMEEGIEKALERALEYAKGSEAMSVPEFLAFIKDY